METSANNYLILKLAVATLLYVFCLCDVCHAFHTNTWAVHIEGGHRVARSLAEKHGFIFEGEIIGNYYEFRHPKVKKRSVDPSPDFHKSLSEEPNVKWIEQQFAKRRVKRNVVLNDPMYPNMWYLNRGRCLDMNVQRAWEMGYTGKGSVVTILDDGIEKNHPDLQQNYDPYASYDINANDPDPQPRYDIFNYNRHGTRCAGEVAATANNSQCSVGVAFDAGIGGIRMLDGDITDSVEARSIGFNQSHIDVYSASWGPDDDGRTVDGPGPLAKAAFERGILHGRGGKGNIFVWASGNGGRAGDSCSCDGYTNSLYTLSVSSATERGTIPWYSEPCASTLATTYSSGSGNDRMIMTTDLRLKCTDRHTGTSASAPLAAGIVAVVLEANPKLTWRDMQHIVVRTARPAHLLSSDWIKNGAGLKVSHSYGFGLMDTSGMVELAKSWKTVPEKFICSTEGTDRNIQITKNSPKKFTITYSDCTDRARKINYLEHVQAKVNLDVERRGAISIFLTSPMGTMSTLLPKRSRDFKHESFKDWEFLSTHSWGESPDGAWILEIKTDYGTATLRSWSLIAHGTKDLPGPGPYKTKADDCNPTSRGPPKVAPPAAQPGNKEKHKDLPSSGKRYYQICDPAALDCGAGMACGRAHDTGSVYVCQCLPSLKYNVDTKSCDTMMSLIRARSADHGDPMSGARFAQSSLSHDSNSHGSLAGLTNPVYLVIGGAVLFLLLLVLVAIAVIRYRRNSKYGKYQPANIRLDDLDHVDPGLSQGPSYRM